MDPPRPDRRKTDRARSVASSSLGAAIARPLIRSRSEAPMS
jgi:hypothetical protein